MRAPGFDLRPIRPAIRENRNEKHQNCLYLSILYHFFLHSPHSSALAFGAADRSSESVGEYSIDKKNEGANDMNRIIPIKLIQVDEITMKLSYFFPSDFIALEVLGGFLNEFSEETTIHPEVNLFFSLSRSSRWCKSFSDEMSTSFPTDDPQHMTN